MRRRDKALALDETTRAVVQAHVVDLRPSRLRLVAQKERARHGEFSQADKTEW